MQCAYNGYLAIVKRLLQKGADPSLRDKDGDTALDWARQRGQNEVVALLSEPRYARRQRRASDRLRAARAAARRRGHMRARAVVSICVPAIACRWRMNGGGSPWGLTGSSPRTSSVPSESLHTARASAVLLGCRASAKRRGGRTGSRQRRGGPMAICCGGGWPRRPAATDSGAPDGGHPSMPARSSCPRAYLFACDNAPCWAPLHSADSVQSPHAVVLGGGAAASAAPDCLGILAATLPALAVRALALLFACDDAPYWAPLHSADACVRPCAWM